MFKSCFWIRNILPGRSIWALLMVISAASGCASLISGTTQGMVFRSTPEGAAVLVDGREIGKTPLDVLMKKGEHRYVAFEKPGYKRATLPMTARLDGWFWGNLVFGGFFGSTTDSVSGASHEYSPNQFLITLEPSGSGSLESKTSIGAIARAREFIILGYAAIIRDLQSGRGEYLNSLIKVLEIPDTQSANATKRLKSLSEAYPEIVDFADKAIEMYLKSGPKEVSDTREISALEVEFRELCAMKRDLAEASIKKMPPAHRGVLTEHVFQAKGTVLATEETFEPFMDMTEKEKSCVDWYVKSFTEYAPLAR